ncbi:MAG TPA: aminodeoxychorismate/anthranilate synthase component II [Cellvibrionaceae bacterium]
MLLMIDNYDSFTYNIVHYLEALGMEVMVARNDAISVQRISELAPSHLMISPGPGKPRDAGISPAVIRTFSGKIPLLGVCLGHQCIAEAFAGTVLGAREIMHGKTSAVWHRGEGVFAGLPNPLTATRYHSLVVDAPSLPDCFDITAWTENTSGAMGEIMGIKHKSLAVEGVQFHPESILTEAGHALLANFLRQA